MTGRRNQPGQVAKKTKRERRPIIRTPRTEKLATGEKVRVPLSEASFVEDPDFQKRPRSKGTASKLIPTNLSMLVNVAKETGGIFHDPIRLARISNRKRGFKGCVVLDGFHRIEALRKAGFKTAEVVIEDMTREEAEREALLANAYHGHGLGHAELVPVIANAVRDGHLFDKDGEKLSIAEACRTITGNRISPRQFRRHVERILGSDEYAAMYGRDDADNAEPAKRHRKTVDYVAEARGLLDELWTLVGRVADEGNETHRTQCAAEIDGRMSEMQRKLGAIWNEFDKDNQYGKTPDKSEEQPF